jgi:hypothetical protein
MTILLAGLTANLRLPARREIVRTRPAAKPSGGRTTHRDKLKADGLWLKAHARRPL